MPPAPRTGCGRDLDVEPDAPVLDVGRVEGDVAVKRGVLPRLYLPQAGHSREHVETAQVAEIVRFTSLAIGGRGPTMLMSPRSTLMNCGNSSSEYFRRKRPTRLCEDRW